MEEVIKLFKQIQATSSLNEKKDIITANKNNELFKKCLRFLLDGNITTGIAEKKYDSITVTTSDWVHCDIDKEFSELLDYIKTHNTGRDEDIIQIQAWCCTMRDDVKEFVRGLITKSIRLGADAKLVNKCVPGLIPTFDVMLGTSIEKCKIKDGTWFSLSHKLNGNRCIYYNGDFYTRQGKKYSGLEHIKRDLESMYIGVIDYVFDGELMYKNPEGLSDSEAFQKGTGIAQSKSESKEELKLIVFDVLPKEEFDRGFSTDTYKKRKQKLVEMKAFETENLEVVNIFYEGTDQSEIWKWLDYAEQHDMEGLMLSLDAPYECKRTKNLIKVKKFFDFDLQIIGYEEGTGRNKGRLGALVVDYQTNPVNVGCGFTDEDRIKFWEQREKLIGRVITVKYKEISKDKKTGLESLQFPIYCGLREEGKEPSYN